MAHVLRIDPQTSIQDGSPILTTLIDLTESRRISDVTAACTSLRGEAQLDCIAEALERPGSLALSLPFPEEHVALSVRIADRDVSASLVGHARFGDSHHEPSVGTAWLVVLDADSHIKDHFEQAMAIAQRFTQALAPGDLLNLVLLGDRQVIADSGWLDAAHRQAAQKILSKQDKPVRSEGRTRPLLSMLKTAARDAFISLEAQQPKELPLHQAMVVISTGYGGGDPETTGPGATQFSEFLTRGRLSEDNTALPKLPVPLISIYAPPKAMAEHEQLARQFMTNLANPAIGGFFTVIRPNQEQQPGRIVDTVRARFADMVIARFRLACVAPSLTQSFSLLFPGSSPQIIGDNSFRDVPLGFDPSQWPLDVDVDLTARTARAQEGIHPEGTLRVFGNFCWEGDLSRPVVYFLPPGEKLPQSLGKSPKAAKEIQKRLTSLDMRGQALAAGSTFAEFHVPANEQILHGEGDNAVVRLVVLDTVLHRTSGVTEATVLQLPGRRRPTSWIYYAAAAALALLLIIIVLLVFRSGRARLPSVTSSLPLRPIGVSPYATPGPVSRGPASETAVGTRATLESSAGMFTILAGTDLRLGRDSTRCTAVLHNQTLKAHHATFRFEQGKLSVRDEHSRAGTWLGDQRLDAGAWTNLKDGDELRVGPEKLRVSMSRTS